MDVVDVVLVVAVVAAAVHGLRLGAVVQVLTYAGFWVGLLLGALLSIAVVSPVRSGAFRTFVTLVLVLGLSLALGIGGRVVGSWYNVTLRRHHLGPLDSILGVAVAVAAVLLTAWVLANVFSQSRYTWLSSAIARSQVLRTVDNVMPPVPSAFARVEGFLDSGGFPPVFAELAPAIAGPVSVPSSAQSSSLAGRALQSTVKVIGVACGYQLEGSGFVVAPGMVATNAHVVAGESATTVVIGGVSSPATVVYFDPGYDLALLRTSASLGPPLTLDPTEVPRGTAAAVVGYPENQSLTVTPAGVAAAFVAEGREHLQLGTRDPRRLRDRLGRPPGELRGPTRGGRGDRGRASCSPARRTTPTWVTPSRRAASSLASSRPSVTTGPVSTGGCTQG